MKVFITFLFLLAAASLGLALPAAPSTPVTPIPVTPVTPSVNATGVPPELVQALEASGTDGGKGPPPISSQCLTALFSVIADKDFAACFPLPVLMEFLPVITDPSQILKNPSVLEKPLTDFCAVPKCDPKVIGKALQTVQDGCKDDTKNPIVMAVIAGLSFYSPVRDIACTKDKDFCLIEEVETVVKLPPSPIKITGDKIADAALVSDPPVMCTKCSKDIVNIFFNFLKENPKLVQLLVALGITQDDLDKGESIVMIKCGASFLDGKIP